jgi:hypothetical protein
MEQPGKSFFRTDELSMEVLQPNVPSFNAMARTKVLNSVV